MPHPLAPGAMPGSIRAGPRLAPHATHPCLRPALAARAVGMDFAPVALPVASAPARPLPRMPAGLAIGRPRPRTGSAALPSRVPYPRSPGRHPLCRSRPRASSSAGPGLAPHAHGPRPWPATLTTIVDQGPIDLAHPQFNRMEWHPERNPWHLQGCLARQLGGSIPRQPIAGWPREFHL